MKIECKLKRQGGTKVTIQTTEYHFAPLEDGAHVADVANEAHQDRFLSIPEAYRVYRGALAAPAGTALASSAPAVVIDGGNTDPVIPSDNSGDGEAMPLLGSNQHPATFDINGKTYTLDEVVYGAYQSQGVSTQEWNELSDETRADLIDDHLDLLAKGEGGSEQAPSEPAKQTEIDPKDTNGDGTVDDKEERAALAAQYKAKFGKNPHYNLSIEKLKAALAE